MTRRGIFLGPVRQAGGVPLGTICILIVVAAIISLSLKLIPHYIEFTTVESVIEQLPPVEVNGMARAEVFDALERRFPLNSLYDLEVRDIIEFERDPESTTITVAYEKREPLFLNLDVVIKFNKQYQYR